jgi:hypothetical protein
MNGYAARYLRGYLGDDFSDDSMFAGDSGSGGVGDVSPLLDNNLLTQIDQGTYVPPADAQFSQAQPGSTVTPDNVFSQTTTGPGGVPVYQMPDGTEVDAYGTAYFPDGSQISALGTVTDAQGNVVFSDGERVLSNGTYIDQFGNQYAPTSPQAQQAQQRAAATGGGSSSGGGSRGGGSGSGQNNALNQALACLLNPNSPQCRQQQQQQSTASSFGSWFQKNWGYLALGLGAFIIVPPLLNRAVNG